MNTRALVRSLAILGLMLPLVVMFPHTAFGDNDNDASGSSSAR